MIWLAAGVSTTVSVCLDLVRRLIASMPATKPVLAPLNNISTLRADGSIDSSFIKARILAAIWSTRASSTIVNSPLARNKQRRPLAGADSAGVALISIYVDLGLPARFHPHQDAVKCRGPRAVDSQIEQIAGLEAQLGGGHVAHVDMPARQECSAAGAARQRHRTLWPDQRDRPRAWIGPFGGDRQLQANRDRVGRGQLDLGVGARRPQHSHLLDTAPAPHDHDLLSGSVVALLVELVIDLQVVPLAKQNGDVLHAQVDVVHRDPDGDRQLPETVAQLRLGGALRLMRLLRQTAQHFAGDLFDING